MRVARFYSLVSSMSPPSSPEQLMEKNCPDIRLPFSVTWIPPEPPLEQLKTSAMGEVLEVPEMVPLSVCDAKTAVQVPDTVIRPG